MISKLKELARIFMLGLGALLAFCWICVVGFLIVLVATALWLISPWIDAGILVMLLIFWLGWVVDLDDRVSAPPPPRPPRK